MAELKNAWHSSYENADTTKELKKKNHVGRTETQNNENKTSTTTTTNRRTHSDFQNSNEINLKLRRETQQKFKRNQVAELVNRELIHRLKSNTVCA